MVMIGLRMTIRPAHTGRIFRHDVSVARIDELRAALDADPDNRDLLAVYGDALLAAGEIRGELIALQLAKPTAERRARIQSIVSQYGRELAGNLADAFLPYRFEDGFVIGGTLNPAAIVEIDDEWKRVRWLRSEWDETNATILDLVTQLDIRHVDMHDYLRTERLLSGPVQSTITRIALPLVAQFPFAYHTAPSLPRLSRVDFHEATEDVEDWANDARLVERLSCVGFTKVPPMPVLEALATRSGALRTVVVLDDERGWCVRITRDRAPGPFTRVIAERYVAQSPAHADELVAALDVIPDAWPTEIAIDCEPMHVSLGEHHELLDAFRRFLRAPPMRTRFWSIR
jgi:hypothetical protein